VLLLIGINIAIVPILKNERTAGKLFIFCECQESEATNNLASEIQDVKLDANMKKNNEVKISKAQKKRVSCDLSIFVLVL